MIGRDDSLHPQDERLLLGLARELPASLQHRFDVHVSGCDDRQRRLDMLRTADSHFRKALSHRPDYPAAVNDRLRLRLARALGEATTGPELAPSAGKFGATRLAVFGSAVALVIAAAFGMTWSGRTPLGETPAKQTSALVRPIPSLTPGATADVSMDLVCAANEPSPPPVPAEMRRHVLKVYAMDDVPHDEFELDYLITPQLGGVTHPANLWPERYDSPVWNAKVKDQLETLLPALVCAGALNLADAQREIATDWIAAYKKYFKSDRPLRPGAIVPGRDPATAAVASFGAPQQLLTMALIGP